MVGAIASIADLAWPSARLGSQRDLGRVERLKTAILLDRSVSVESSAEDDETLIGRVARGDASAYRKLADRYLTPILRYTTRLLGNAPDAEDATQETFLRLWQHASRYEPRGAKASTWLYRIAHNVCVDRLRRRRDHADVDALELASSEGRPSGEVARRELGLRMERALAQLPERQRAAIVLVHSEGLSNREAAAVLECGAEALESLLSRGRRALRTLLAEDGEST